MAQPVKRRNSWVGDQDDVIQSTLSDSLLTATSITFVAGSDQGTVTKAGSAASEFVAQVVLGADELTVENIGSYRIHWVVTWPGTGPRTYPENDAQRDYWTLSDYAKP